MDFPSVWAVITQKLGLIAVANWLVKDLNTSECGAMEHHTCKEQSLTPEVIVKQETGNIISGMDGVFTHIPTVQITQGSGKTEKLTGLDHNCQGIKK